MKKTMFILGATGFVGSEVVREALNAGWAIKALARSKNSSDKLVDLGITPIVGDASDPSGWASELRNTDVLVDLIQPEIPIPFRVKAVRKISEQRQALTKGILDALGTLNVEERPLYFSISGTDDLEPDPNGLIGSESRLANSPSGFGHIGIPVRRLVERSSVDAVFIYLGTVYGAGKTFAETIIPQLAQGKWKVIGDGRNHFPIVHVEDVASGLVHLAGLDRALTVGKSFVLADASRTTAKELFTGTAAMMGAKVPGTVPKFLASLVTGKIVIETMTHDLIADPSGLTETGFEFKYPSYREGMPPTLEKLSYPASRQSQEGPMSKKKVWPFWTLLIATLAVIAAENFGYFSVSLPSLLRASSGLPILDMRLWYTPADAYQLFEKLGPLGRSDLWQLYLTIDILIPLLLIAIFRSALYQGEFGRFRVVALFGGAFDYLENISVLILLMNYPTHLDRLVTLSACFTLLKFVSYVSTACLAIVGYLIKFVRRDSQLRVDYNSD